MAEPQAISSYLTTLKWGTSASTLSKVVDIVDFGDLFGEPNMIDTTHLGNRRQTQISGTLAGDNIPFTVFYTKANMKTCREDEEKPLYFALTFQDGSGWAWQGEYRISQSGKGVDEAIDFTINVAVSTDMEWFEDESEISMAFSGIARAEAAYMMEAKK